MTAIRIAAFVLASVMAGGIFAGLIPPAMADVGDISVGGVWISKITQNAAGFLAEQRATEVNKRITEVLSDPRFRHAGATVSVRPMGDAAAILVGDQLVFTVTPADATGTGVTTVELARQWAQRLAQGLSKALPDANFHTF
jgi:hypothetical protein